MPILELAVFVSLSRYNSYAPRCPCQRSSGNW